MKHGCVYVDLVNRKVYGDLAHCPRSDLTESAVELLTAAPQGTRAIGKAYDNECYIYGPKRLSKVLTSIVKPASAVPSPTVNQEVHFHYMGSDYKPEPYLEKL